MVVFTCHLQWPIRSYNYHLHQNHRINFKQYLWVHSGLVIPSLMCCMESSPPFSWGPDACRRKKLLLLAFNFNACLSLLWPVWFSYINFPFHFLRRKEPMNCSVLSLLTCDQGKRKLTQPSNTLSMQGCLVEANQACVTYCSDSDLLPHRNVYV